MCYEAYRTEIECPALKDPENGSVDDGDNLPGTVAKYTCDYGFRLVGFSKRLCQKDGSWAGEVPICKGMTSFAIRSTIDSHSNRINCDTFSSHHMLFVHFDSAIICPKLDDPEDGQVTVTGLTPSSTAEYSCNKGFTLFGTARTCQDNGEWSGKAPICKRT